MGEMDSKKKGAAGSMLNAVGNTAKKALSVTSKVADVASTAIVSPKYYWDKLRRSLPQAVQNVVGTPPPEDLKRPNKQYNEYGITLSGEGSEVRIGMPRYVLSKDALQKFATGQDAISGDGSRIIDHSKKAGILTEIGDRVPAVGDTLNEMKDLSKKVTPEGQDDKDFNKLQALRKELRAKGGDVRVDLSNPAVPCVVVDIDVAGKSEEELKAEFQKVLKNVCGVTSGAAVNAEFNRFMQQVKEVRGKNPGISQDTTFSQAPSKSSASFEASSLKGGPGSGQQPSRGVASDKDGLGDLGPITTASVQQQTASETIAAAGKGDTIPTTKMQFTPEMVKEAIEFAQNIKHPEQSSDSGAKEPWQSGHAKPSHAVGSVKAR